MCRCSEATSWTVHKGTAILVTHCERRNTSILELKRPFLLNLRAFMKNSHKLQAATGIKAGNFPLWFFFPLLFSFPETQKVLWPLLQKIWFFFLLCKMKAALFIACVLFVQSLKECAVNRLLKCCCISSCYNERNSVCADLCLCHFKICWWQMSSFWVKGTCYHLKMLIAVFYLWTIVFWMRETTATRRIAIKKVFY